MALCSQRAWLPLRRAASICLAGVCATLAWAQNPPQVDTPAQLAVQLDPPLQPQTATKTINQMAPQLAPLLTPTGDLNAAWRFVGFPKKHADLPATRFEAAAAPQTTRRATEAGSATPDSPATKAVLRVSTASSYGTLVHNWQGTAPGALQWTWRLEQPLTGGKTAADLTTKAGDDAALKLCVMFDHPLARVPFFERTLLRLARTLSGEALPAATVCYVWDSAQPAGLRGANPYTRRVRYISLRGTEASLNRWLTEQRRVDQDYLDLFQDETTAGTTPRVLAVVLGADSDNTASHSRGWFDNVQWQVQATGQ